MKAHLPSTLAQRVGMAALLCSVWLAPAPVEARGCSDPASAPFLTCSVAECVALQADVDSKCKSPPPTRCSLITGCSNLKAMEARFRNCALARDLINGRCWGGGDPGHRAASGQAWTGVSKCVARQALPEPIGCADPCPQNPIARFDSADLATFLELLQSLEAQGLLEPEAQGPSETATGVDGEPNDVDLK